MDLSHLPITPRAKANGESGNFWYLEYNYVLCFSAVELRAQMSWMEGVRFFLFKYAMSNLLMWPHFRFTLGR